MEKKGFLILAILCYAVNTIFLVLLFLVSVSIASFSSTVILKLIVYCVFAIASATLGNYFRKKYEDIFDSAMM